MGEWKCLAETGQESGQKLLSSLENRGQAKESEFQLLPIEMISLLSKGLSTKISQASRSIYKLINKKDEKLRLELNILLKVTVSDSKKH